jgi:hypothetical protein
MYEKWPWPILTCYTGVRPGFGSGMPRMNLQSATIVPASKLMKMKLDMFAESESN